MNRCAACKSVIRGVDYLECQGCRLVYHSDCVNSPPTPDWVCPSCTAKLPKGDNTNRVIRSTTPTGLNSPIQVTQRKKRFITDVDSTGITVEDIRALLREELKEQDNRLVKKIDELSTQINDFKQSMDFLNEQFEKLRADNIAQQSSINSLKKENESLRGTVNNLVSRLNQIDQISRAPNLEIQCVPENKSENLISLVKQVGRVVDCPISESDIHYCSRVAKNNSESLRPRNILIKFSHPRLRDNFLAAVITFNKKNPSEKLNTSHLGIGGDKKSAVYVAENLSPENKSLHAAARSHAKQFNYKFVWVRGGRIFMRKTESSGYIYVRDMETLTKLS